MALFNSFTFDNENSLDSGIYITGEAVFNAPERVVEMVNVPGRNGAIAIDEGRFENIAVTYPAGCFADNMADFAEKVAEFRNILASRFTYKRLTDSYHPDEFRMGLYRSGLEVDAVRYNSAGEFDIEFDCKPQRFLKSGEIPVDYTPGQSPSDEQTKTGSIVTFEAEEDTIITDVIADINPIQDLHGYDKPWAGGNGKNKLPQTRTTQTVNGVTFTVNSDGSVTANGTAGSGGASFYPDINTNTSIGNGDYIVTGCPTGGGASTYRIWCDNRNSAGTSTINTTADAGSGANLSVTEGKIRFYIFITAGYTANNIVFKPMFRLASEADASFEPYSNICPISGWDSVKVTRTGKNLYEPYQGNTYTIDLNGTRYGGTLDVTRGVLSSSDRESITITAEGQLSGFLTSASGAYAFLNETTGLAKIDNANVVCMCSSAISISFNNRVSDTYKNENRVYGDERGNIIVRASAGGASTKTELFNLFKGSQIVYELATPITVQLTPTEVKTLLGTNNIWADSGDITVKYGTNPYIIVNPTAFPSKPLLEVTGVGSFWLGDTQITITGTSGQVIYIDCETGECYKENGGIISPANGLVTLNRLDFPELTSGINNIQLGSGISNVKITPRWWRI